MLLDALRAAGHLERYVPQDVSESALLGAIERLAVEYPDLAVRGIVGDFTGASATSRPRSAAHSSPASAAPCGRGSTR